MTQHDAGQARNQGDPWAQAVSKAEDHLRHEDEVASPRQPLPGLRIVFVVLGLILAAAIAVISPRLMRGGPEGLPAVDQAADLRAEVGRLVQQIEAYRQERGTLPAPAMLSPFLEEGYRYRITDRDALRYEVRRAAGGVEVVYDGSLPLNVWLVAGGLNESEAP